MKKKITALCLCMALLAIAVVGGTLAYFTDTDTKTNVFTQGKVDITLTEPEWDKLTDNDKKLIPSREIVKDPTITVADDSETAYTFMKVKLSADFLTLLNDYATFKDMDLTTVEAQKALIAAWFKTTVGPKIMNINVAEGSVILGVMSPKEAGQSVKYFDAITVPADVPTGMIKENGNYTIEITAYAIQAEGLANREAAYEALFPSTPTA